MKFAKVGILMGVLALAVLVANVNPPASERLFIPVTSNTPVSVFFTPTPILSPDRLVASLMVTRSLDLSTLRIFAGQPCWATFTIRNAGSYPVEVGRLGVAVRDGLTWKPALETGFSTQDGVLLQSGEDYSFTAKGVFSQPGEYFAEPSVWVNGGWRMIPGATRVWFEVDLAQSGGS